MSSSASDREPWVLGRTVTGWPSWNQWYAELAEPQPNPTTVMKVCAEWRLLNRARMDAVCPSKSSCDIVCRVEPAYQS